MSNIIKNALVETHHSIRIVECYHKLLLYHHYQIPTDLALQIFFKTINDSVGPNGLVLTLLIFGAYPRITKLDASSLAITQRVMAMKRTMNEVRKCTALLLVNNALNNRNESSTTCIYILLIDSPVSVYQKDNASHQKNGKDLIISLT